MSNITIKHIKEVIKNDDAIKKYPWYSRNILVPLSVYPTRWLIKFHPNFLSIVMIVIGLISLPFFYLGSYWNTIFAVLILELFALFDGIDGNVARVMNKRSWRGKYLDFIPTIVINPLVLVALGFGAYNLTKNINYIILGFSAGFFYLAKEPARLFRYLMISELKLNIKSNYQSEKKNKNLVSKLNELSYIIFDYHGIMNIILLFAIFNISKYLVIFYGLTMPILFIARVSYEFYFWKNLENSRMKK